MLGRNDRGEETYREERGMAGRTAEDSGSSAYHSAVVQAVQKHLICLEITQGDAKRRKGGKRAVCRDFLLMRQVLRAQLAVCQSP